MSFSNVQVLCTGWGHQLWVIRYCFLYHHIGSTCHWSLIFSFLVLFWCHSNVFPLRTFVSLSWWLPPWMSRKCVRLSLCAMYNHACKSACSCFDRITHPRRSASSYINCCLLRYQMHKQWPCMSLFLFFVFTVCYGHKLCAFFVVETGMLLERLNTPTGIVTVLFVSRMKFIDILQDQVIFTGGIFGHFPSPGGTSSESHTVL